MVNGHNCQVTENLVFALSNHEHILKLRSSSDHPHIQAQYMWADAVCINQNDFEERVQQVLRMRQIYQRAIVCVYLKR